jgi:hypothetical protein
MRNVNYSMNNVKLGFLVPSLLKPVWTFAFIRNLRINSYNFKKFALRYGNSGVE